MPAGGVQQRVAAGIVEFEIPAGQRRHDPPRQRARSGVTSAADLSRCRASRIADRNRQRLHFRVGRFHDREVGHAAFDLRGTSGCASRSCHCSVAVEGRIVSDTSTSRPCGAGVPRISTSLPLDAETIQQPVHRELRMVRRGLRGELALRVS